MKMSAHGKSSLLSLMASMGVVLTLAALGAGCEGCKSYFEPENNLEFYEGAAPEEVAYPSYCQGVELSRQGAEPFERVDIDLQVFDVDVEGPKPREELFAVKIIFGEAPEESYVLPVYYDVEAGHHFFISPFHPDLRSGGEVTLRFDDGETSCEEEFVWEVAPLPPNSGALEAMLESSTALSMELLATYGLTVEEVLYGELDEIPVMAIPLAVQAWATGHPDNPESLLAMMRRGEFPGDVSAEDLELASAVIAKSGMGEAIEQARLDLAQLEAESDVELRFTERGPSEGMALGEDLGQRRQPLCNMLASKMEVEISNATELSYYMRKAQISEAMGARIAPVAGAVGVMSVVPGLAGAGAVVGVALAVDKFIRDWHAKTYPRHLINGEVRTYVASFKEDFQAAEVWDGYYVDAHAPGWDFTYDFLKGVFDLALAIVGPGQVLVKGKSAIALFKNDLDKFSSYADAFGQNAVDFLGGQLAGSHYLKEAFHRSGICKVNPGPWEGIKLNPESTQVNSEYRGGIGSRANGPDVAAGFCSDGPMVTSKQMYEPRNSEGGMIRVSASGAASDFPPMSNEQTSRWEGAVSIVPIRVVMETPNVMGLPGQRVRLEGHIENANDPSGIWEVVMGEATLENEGREENRHWVDVVLPEDEEAFPVVVELRSRSSRGLRSPTCDPVPRSATAVIRDETYLRINPRVRCLSEDETHQFEAEYASADPSARPVWSVTDGSISQNGLFVPGEAEEVTITAHLEGTDVTDSVRVRVGHCECFYDVSVAGLANGTMGDFMGITALYADGMLLIEFDHESNPYIHNIVAEVPGPFPTVVPASGSIWLNELYYGPGPLATMYDDSTSVLTITRWTPQNYIEGVLRAYAPVGVLGLPPNEQIFSAATYVEVYFMTPVRTVGSPLRGLFVKCPLRREEGSLI
ncbi:hypothetical protein FRC91_17365 [Bradymonadales bacterium TMQ1]|nr:hypothetical protein FRC91_17365 [Bradymonadales bacterium TMQ1]